MGFIAGRTSRTARVLLDPHFGGKTGQAGREAVRGPGGPSHFVVGSVLCLLCLLLAACTSTPPQQSTTGVAYAGPATLNLRKDLGAKASLIGSVKHGDRLEVLDTRRKFAKVRTAAGVEGWTDLSSLLSEQQMNDLRALAASAAKLPSQGAATVYDLLNIHAEPYRQSPSFFQIPEGGTVDVIGHRVTPHSAPPAARPKPPVRRASAYQENVGEKDRRRCPAVVGSASASAS